MTVKVDNAHVSRTTKVSRYSWPSLMQASSFFRTSRKSTHSRGQKFASSVLSARNSSSSCTPMARWEYTSFSLTILSDMTYVSWLIYLLDKVWISEFSL